MTCRLNIDNYEPLMFNTRNLVRIVLIIDSRKCTFLHIHTYLQRSFSEPADVPRPVLKLSFKLAL
jgi:hypothetical protein